MRRALEGGGGDVMGFTSMNKAERKLKREYDMGMRPQRRKHKKMSFMDVSPFTAF